MQQQCRGSLSFINVWMPNFSQAFDRWRRHVVLFRTEDVKAKLSAVPGTGPGAAHLFRLRADDEHEVVEGVGVIKLDPAPRGQG